MPGDEEVQGKMNQLRGENRLVSLVEKAKAECQGLSLAVKNDFKTIEEAREAGLTWGEITEGLGFHLDKWREVQRAYSREKARLEKKGGVKPAPQGVTQKTENGKQNEKQAGVTLIDNKVSKSGACEIFKSFRSID